MKKERMPRKMKKRFKKMMSFYEERRMEYDILKNLAVLFSATLNDSKTEDKEPDGPLKNIILKKLRASGIFPEDILKMSYNDKLKTVNITLNDSVQNITMFVNVGEGRKCRQ